MARVMQSGKYDGMDMNEVAQLDPDYVLWASEQGLQVTDEATATAIRTLERGQHWDYDYETDLEMETGINITTIGSDDYGSYW